MSSSELTTRTAAGIVIADMDGLARFAAMVEKSGLAPKDFKTAASIGVAVQHGLELGLSPLQSLHSIAVINGKPGIYGDAALALVEGSGLVEDVDEYFEQGGKRVSSPTAFPDDATAVCMVKRRGRRERASRFSVADARKAGLWGKSGPWAQYPARMLQMRARGFALRDVFPDVLKGLKTTEELQDYPDALQPRVVQSEPAPIRIDTPEAAAKVLPAPEAKPVNGGKATSKQLAAIRVVANKLGWEEPDLHEWSARWDGCSSPQDLTRAQADECLSQLLELLEQEQARKAQEEVAQ